MLAPIALYPDPLLAEVLMASTYPLDVVQAERWLQRNKKLKGDELKAGVDKQDWDDSIKSLIATPDVLAMMSDKIDWTEKLGDAVSAQQPDVMDAVQRLRARAQSNNKLTSSKEQTVSVKQVQNKQVIAIEPTDPVRYTSRIMTLASSMADGHIPHTRRTIGQRPAILPPALLRPASHSAPDMHSAAGHPAETIGAVASTGITTTSILAARELAVARITGSHASIIARVRATGAVASKGSTSAATAASKC